MSDISQGICQRSLSRNSVRETIEGGNQEAHQGQLLQAFDVSPHIVQFEGFQGQFKEHFNPMQGGGKNTCGHLLR